MPPRTTYRPGEPSWVHVGTADLDASIAFYSALFGWEIEKGPAEMGHYSIATKGGQSVCGIAPMTEEGQPPMWSSYISVENADQTVAVASENGAQVYLPPMEVMDLGRMAFFADPTGAALGVWQPKDMLGAEVTQDEGTLAWVELSCRDLATAVPFYRALFGWEVLDEGGYTHFQLGTDSVAGAMDMPPTIPAFVPNYWMPYFAAEDPRAQAARVAELGGQVFMPYLEAGGVAFSVVADPSGATFGLLKQLQA